MPPGTSALRVRQLFVATLLALGFSLESQGQWRPVTPEIAIAQPPSEAAPGPQSDVLLATNGTIGLAVWWDLRADYQLMAARVACGGDVLDPAGIPLGPRAPLVTFWNGASFVVATRSEYLLVGSDGVFTGTIPLEISGGADAAVAGGRTSQSRVLFIRTEGGTTFGTVVDARGYTIARDVPLSSMSSKRSLIGYALAGGERGFLVLRREHVGSGIAPETTAIRVSLDGDVMSVADAKLPAGPVAVSERGYGYFAAVQESLGHQFSDAFTLDDNGVLIGRSVQLRAGASFAGPPAMKTADGGFVMVWHERPGDVRSEFWSAHLPPQSSIPIVRMLDTPGCLQSWDVVSENRCQLFAWSNGADVFVQTSPAGAVRHLAQAPRRQKDANLLPIAGGVVLTWTEESRDRERAMFQRFTPDGVALDPQPVEVFGRSPSVEPLPPLQTVTAGSALLFGWPTRQGLFALRRLDAATGQWVDASPAILSLPPSTRIAAAGTNAMAVYVEKNSGPTQLIIVLPLQLGATIAQQPPAGYADGVTKGEVAVASDGEQFLIVWSEEAPCPAPCPAKRSDVHAMRVRPDGSGGGTGRLTLATSIAGSVELSVAYAGSRYLALWSAAGVVSGAAVPNGSGPATSPFVLDSAPSSSASEGTGIAVRAHDGAIALRIHRRRIDGLSTFETVTFAEEQSPAAIDLPRITLLREQEAGFFASLAVTPIGAGRYAVAHTRTGDVANGRSPRLTLQLFAAAGPTRRRGVR